MFEGLKTPVPVLAHLPPVALVTIPFKVIFSFEHTCLSFPAETIGAGVMVTVIEAAFKQAPVFVAVNVNFSVPFAASATEGIYVPIRLELPAVKVPEPLVLHTPVVLLPDMVPLSDTVELLAQTVWSLPADTRAGLSITTSVLVIALVHEFTVTEREYFPAAATAALSITGFCKFDTKPLGPAQLYVAPLTFKAKSCNGCPAHTGLLVVAVGASGVWFTTTSVKALVVTEHPGEVTATVYRPLLIKAALLITGFCWLDVNPAGPVHL
jgi:hypothetical protein